MTVTAALLIIGAAFGLFLTIVFFAVLMRFVNGAYRIAEAIENHARIQIGEPLPESRVGTRRRRP